MKFLHRLSAGLFLGLACVLIGSRVEAQSFPAGLSDRKYNTSCGRDKPAVVDVKGGKFGRYFLLADEDRRIELILLGAEKITVSGDRRQHYAVFARCNVLGRSGHELFLLRRSGKGFIQVASTVSAGVYNLYGLKQIHQTDGLIVVGLDYLENRSTFIKRYELRFRFESGKLTLENQGLAREEK